MREGERQDVLAYMRRNITAGFPRTLAPFESNECIRCGRRLPLCANDEQFPDAISLKSGQVLVFHNANLFGECYTTKILITAGVSVFFRGSVAIHVLTIEIEKGGELLCDLTDSYMNIDNQGTFSGKVGSKIYNSHGGGMIEVSPQFGPIAAGTGGSVITTATPVTPPRGPITTRLLRTAKNKTKGHA